MVSTFNTVVTCCAHKDTSLATFYSQMVHAINMINVDRLICGYFCNSWICIIYVYKLNIAFFCQGGQKNHMQQICAAECCDLYVMAPRAADNLWYSRWESQNGQHKNQQILNYLQHRLLCGLGDSQVSTLV